MSDQTDKRERKSTRGNSALGSKFYFFLGFIISSVLNIGGIAKVIDSFVEWTGIIHRAVDLYTKYIIENIDFFISLVIRTLDMDADIPLWISTYASISTSTAVMYLFAAKIANLDTDTKVGILGVLRGLPPFTLAKTWFSKNGIFLGKSLKEVKSQSVLITAFTIFFGLCLFLSAWIFLTAILLAVLPFIVASSTYRSIIIYFNHDFSSEPVNDQEKIEFNRLRFIYNSTLVFWFCVILSFILIGVLIKANDIIDERCLSNHIPRNHWICKSY